MIRMPKIKKMLRSMTLQNYFGLAFRNNSGDIDLMRTAIGAVLFHCSDIQVEHERHKFVHCLI